MDLLKLCPELVPLNKEKTSFRGLIQRKGHRFFISIQLKSPDTVKGALIACDRNLQQLLCKDKILIKKVLSQHLTLPNFIADLYALLDCRLGKVDSKLPKNDGVLSLIKQINTIGWNNLHSVSQDMQNLMLSTCDERGRTHHLTIIHSSNGAVSYESEFPALVNFQGDGEDSLVHAFRAFESFLPRFQQFWNSMDDVDANTWVLEPEKPTRKDVKRRIVIESNVSLLIAVDPLHPLDTPELKFLGPDRVVHQLKATANQNFSLWNPADSLLTNLSNLLQVKFPGPTNSTKETFKVECAVCYSYRLADDIPIYACEGSNCNKVYHHICLYESLKCSPASKQSFEKIFGECIYCSKLISCDIPSATKWVLQALSASGPRLDAAQARQ